MACIGVNDIGIARLRLMMRMGEQQLRATWRMGEPEEADLLVLAAGSSKAEQAAMRARAQGVRCLMLGGRRGETDVLPVPFDSEDLVAALNSEAPKSLNLDLLDAESPDFFLHSERPGAPAARDERRWQEPIDMDKLFQRDPLGDRAEIELPPRKPPAASSRLDELVPTVAPRNSPVRRNPFLEDEPGTQPQPAYETAAPASKRMWQVRDTPHCVNTGISRGRSGSSETHPLAAYLENDLLVGPSRIQLPRQAELILDPKHRVYHIEGDLKAAERYVRSALPLDAWRPVTNTQLQPVRQACPGRSYLRLKWLFALRQAGGWLPQHLDPGGTYWLRQTLELDEKYDVYRRIGRVLMQSHRLHEVVKVASVTMQDVFDAVAAYDAIGMVQFTPRERLR